MENAIVQNRTDLERLEGVITRNLQSFYEVGRALMEIRDRGLYRDVLGFATFEEYCKAKWDFSRIRAYQLIEAVEVRENVLTQVNIEPLSEKQLRPLARLEPEQQREAWQKAVETAPEGKVTAAHVSKVVRGMVGTQEGAVIADGPKPINESANFVNIKVSWHACSDSDKKKFVRWMREYYPKYLS